MDIITHGMTGVIVAAPLADSHPVTAACVAVGSVLPDLDILARLVGRRVYLRCHQTMTHSLPMIGALTVVLLLVCPWIGVSERWAPLGLAAGMLLHAAMDISNTYGAAILWPVARRRFSLSWLFFIDATTLAVTGVLCLAAIWSLWSFRSTVAPAIACGAFLVLWWSFRLVTARMAKRQAGRGRDLVPSALWPWRFYGYDIDGDKAHLYRLNAITGVRSPQGECRILDRLYAGALEALPEFRIMRELSAGYHVTDAEPDGAGTRLTCRDLRTRNFGGRFGMLEVQMRPDGRVEEKVFHV